MGVPVVYRRSGEQIISSYSFADTVQNVGYIKFYGLITSDDELLTPQTPYSNEVTKSAVTVITTTPAKVLDVDFDVLFNVQARIRGLAYVTVPVANYAPDSAITKTVYIVARIRKYDGSTETEIANKQGKSWTYATTATNIYTSLHTVAINVPLTKIKKSEYLRVTIEVWASINSGTTGPTDEIWIGADPQGRLTSWDNDNFDLGNWGAAPRTFASGDVTTLSATIPFMVDQ